MHCGPPGSSVRGILQARILVGCHFLPHPGCTSGQLNRNPWGWSLASVVFNTPQVTPGFPGGLAGEESACNVGDLGWAKVPLSVLGLMKLGELKRALDTLSVYIFVDMT